MLDIKITNKECEKMDFEGDGSELMNQLEFVVASVLLTMIEQGGFDREDLENEVPLGRLGTPDEVASAILFFAENGYVTGQVLGVNGGIV